ncbi:MAG: alpha/beta hydrolase family protein [Acidimicrobiales bacterium]
MWNHGSEPSVLANEGTALAAFYNNAGFVFFMPVRRGHQPSPGPYNTKLSGLLDEAEDVAAGVAYVRTLSTVDPTRIVVSGASIGGIMTLLAADKDLGLKAAVAFAPGAMSWSEPGVQPVLINAARQVKVPTFIIQANNDYSIGPAQVLGSIVAHNNVQPHLSKIYPAYGTTPQEGHGLFATAGFAVWGADVLAFVQQALQQH